MAAIIQANTDKFGKFLFGTKYNLPKRIDNYEIKQSPNNFVQAVNHGRRYLVAVGVRDGVDKWLLWRFGTMPHEPNRGKRCFRTDEPPLVFPIAKTK